MTVHPLSRCIRCHEPATITLVVSDGADQESADVCATCRVWMVERMRHLDRQHEFLVRNGVSEERATEIMRRRIDRDQ